MTREQAQAAFEERFRKELGAIGVDYDRLAPAMEAVDGALVEAGVSGVAAIVVLRAVSNTVSYVEHMLAHDRWAATRVADNMDEFMRQQLLAEEN